MFNDISEWSQRNKEFFNQNGIKTVKEVINDYGACIEHETSNSMGQIAVNKEGHYDIEIYEINSEMQLMRSYYAFQTKFHEDLVCSYVRILLESK